MTFSRTLIAGIGSPHGDDQAGWLVTERLAGNPDFVAEYVVGAASRSENPRRFNILTTSAMELRPCNTLASSASNIGPSITVRGAHSPIELLDWLDHTDRLMICDACRGLGRAGRVKRWTWPAIELEDVSWSGTHDLTLPVVLQLADRLGRLPPHVTIWSVEGRDSDTLAPISAEVAAALPTLVRAIAADAQRDERVCMNDPW